MRIQVLDAIFDQQPVDGLTHNFYRYPARFSPRFAREIIRQYTNVGDVVYDPFVGGGTTLVEARSLGRIGIGTDVNSLAVFVSTVKTTKLFSTDAEHLRSWSQEVLPKIKIQRQSTTPMEWVEHGYQINIDNADTWRIRKIIELFLQQIALLPVERQQNFARCVLLSTAQWALDCRSNIPSVQQFRDMFMNRLESMLEGAMEYAKSCRENPMNSKVGKDGVACFEHSAAEADRLTILKRCPPKLIVTSPPYPGTHVLYHRWQVQGRRETKAGYWIANEQDGHFAPYYCMGERKRKDNADYFENLQSIFESLARIVTPETLIAQMVAFPQPEWQLNEYLDVMKQCGFKELKKASNLTKDGRVWRAVPNRKFYTAEHSRGTGNEVVLFHALR